MTQNTENKLLNTLLADIKISNSETIKGLGDDGAVLDLHGKSTIICSKMISEAVDFDLSYVPLKHLGYKTVTSSISNAIAMNSTPKHLSLNLAVPQRINEAMLKEFFEGVKQACKLYHIDLVAGDLSASVSGFMISTTVVGTTNFEKISYQANAQQSDVICVTGDLGSAMAGLKALQYAKKEFMETQKQPELNEYSYLIERQLKPESRLDAVRLLEEKGITPTSMTDISKGLASDLVKVLDKSGLGCVIYEDKIPVAKETSRFVRSVGENLYDYILSAGEDYELLFTISAKEFEQIKDIEGISPIGYTTDKSEGTTLSCKDDKQIDLKKHI